MKLSLLLISLMVGGCSCCSPEIQYEELPPIVKINERYIPIPEILIDGAELPIIKEDNLWTFSGEATDSTTGKKVELSGVVDTVSKKILYTVHVKKDSVKVQDTSKTVTLKAIPKEKGLMERFFENVYYVASFVLAIITLLIIYTVVKK